MRLVTLIVDANSFFSEELERKGHTVNFCETNYPTRKKTRKLKSMRSHKLKLKGNLSTAAKEMAVEEDQDNGSTTLEPPEYPELMGVVFVGIKIVK